MKPRRDNPSKSPLDYYNTLRADHEAAQAPLDPERYRKRYSRWRRWRMIVYLVMLGFCAVGMVFAIRWIFWYKALLERQMAP